MLGRKPFFFGRGLVIFFFERREAKAELLFLLRRRFAQRGRCFLFLRAFRPSPPSSAAMVRFLFPLVACSTHARESQLVSRANSIAPAVARSHGDQRERGEDFALPSFQFHRHRRFFNSLSLPPSLSHLSPPPPQSKKRGFSLEEKRQAVLGIFHESSDVFVLKVKKIVFDSSPLTSTDVFFFLSQPRPRPSRCTTLPNQDIEKLAPKRGVVLQAVKEVLQGLVDEDLVHCEKIGISNFFW